VLTIGESDGFARAGGMVNFVIDAGRVRFDVNQKAAERRGLRLSSRMLRLARRVT
jgi:YfiR/HmsC-like